MSTNTDNHTTPTVTAEETALRKLGFNMEVGPTQIVKHSGWNDQVVGQTTVVLKYGDHEIWNGEYNRGLGHFDQVPPMPVKDDSLFTLDERRQYISEYTHNIERLQALRPEVKRFDVDGSFVQAFDRFKSDLERRRKTGKKVTERDLQRLADATEYVNLVGRCFKDKSLKKENRIFYPSLYDGAIGWYKQAIERHQQDIDDVCQHEKELAQWEKEVLGKWLEDDCGPGLVEVVHCVVCCDATEEDFDDWCDMFGYSNDSIKALKIWEDCQTIGNKLKAAEADVEAVQSILEDY